MLAEKERYFQPCVATLDTLVPLDNFYRQVEAKLDLSFVRDLVRDYYACRMGRPSLDPVVFFKLQLIMFFEGIRSERQLMVMVNTRLDHRWFIGYDLNEPVPDHSSLSKIRTRYGLDVFQRFFEKIVELCIDAGLVWGKELYLDGTKVQGNAAFSRNIPRFYHKALEHLNALFDSVSNPEIAQSKQPEAKPRGFVGKYEGHVIHSRPSKYWYTRKADIWVNPTDPDATPLWPDATTRAKIGYHNHYVVDGGKARIILGALVTSASVMDNTPMLDLVRWSRFRWQLDLDIAVGDTRYGTILNLVGLEQDGICAYVPTPNFSQRTDFYPPERFRYDAVRDCFICPQGQELPRYKQVRTEREYVYRADAAICNACPVKPQCTNSRSGRSLRRSFFQDILDRVDSYRETEAYKKAMRKRQVWVEPMFAEAKQWHNMQKFRLRGLIKVNIEGLLTAAGQNIKRLLKVKPQPYLPDPGNTVALRVGLTLFLNLRSYSELFLDFRLRTFSTR